MISTGGTVAESVTALLEAGARPEIVVVATHGLLLPGARDKLDHPAVREVLVTDTVAVADRNWPQLRVVSIAPLIAGAAGAVPGRPLDRRPVLRKRAGADRCRQEGERCNRGSFAIGAKQVGSSLGSSPVTPIAPTCSSWPCRVATCPSHTKWRAR
jgi:hypothetical protein